MDKKGFVKYYEEIKDEKDRNSVLCEYGDITFYIALQMSISLFLTISVSQLHYAADWTEIFSR
jgi:hypothetical protein